jgi:hypothetical protein
VHAARNGLVGDAELQTLAHVIDVELLAQVEREEVPVRHHKVHALGHNSHRKLILFIYLFTQ